MAKKQKRSRKGFNRSAKQWEESIATHIGKFIDKLNPTQLMELISNGIVAYAGYKAVEKLAPEGANLEMKLGGAASGVIALQLAKSMNLAAGTAGTAYLASLGIVNFWDPISGAMKQVFPFYIESLKSPVSTFPFIIPHILP